MSEPTGMPQAPLAGLRVLIVEDEFLVCLSLEYMLETLGCEVIGPAARLDQALDLARTEPLDGATLDLNMAGQESYPVAELLKGRGVPFVFITGYAERSIAAPFRSVPKLIKPVSPMDLEATLRKTFQPKRQQS